MPYLNDELRLRLKDLVETYGPRPSAGHDEAWFGEDERRCRSLLKDVFPDFPMEINMLTLAVREQIPSRLRTTPNMLALAMGEATKRLHRSHGIDPRYARWVAETWAVALGLLDAGKATPAVVLEGESGSDLLPPSVGTTGAPAAQSLAVAGDRRPRRGGAPTIPAPADPGFATSSRPASGASRPAATHRSPVAPARPGRPRRLPPAAPHPNPTWPRPGPRPAAGSSKGSPSRWWRPARGWVAGACTVRSGRFRRPRRRP